MRLSERYYHAVVTGDKAEEARIHQEIANKYRTAPPAQSDRWLFSPLFTGDRTPALDLKAALDKRYGEEWVGWMPETLDQMILMDFNTVPTQQNREKVLAMKMCLNINYAWTDWKIFQKVVLALNGIIPNFEVVEDPSLSQVMRALPILRKLRPEDEFEDDVKKYIAVLCKAEDLIMPPPQLEGICGTYVDRITNPENLHFKDAIKKRLVELIEHHDMKSLKEDDLVDIQAKRLMRVMQSAQIPT